MKKVLLAVLFLAFLNANAKEGLFIGVGGSYGMGAKIDTRGPDVAIVPGFQFSNGGFPKVDFIVGQETFFSQNFGIRYYGNVNYGFMFGQRNRITNLGLGGNLDLVFNLPLGEAFGLRFLGGLNAEVGLLNGKPIDEIKAQYENQLNTGGNFESSRSNLRYGLAANLGMQFLFAKHHALEVGAKIPFLGQKTTLYSYKNTVTPNSPKSEIRLNIPPVDLSVKYVFIF